MYILVYMSIRIVYVYSHCTYICIRIYIWVEWPIAAECSRPRHHLYSTALANGRNME